MSSGESVEAGLDTGHSQPRGSDLRVDHDGCTITQTPPSPTAMSVGLGPTLIVATTLPRFGSIRETVPASRFAVQTLPSPAATATGASPTLTLPTTRFVFG